MGESTIVAEPPAGKDSREKLIHGMIPHMRITGCLMFLALASCTQAPTPSDADGFTADVSMTVDGGMSGLDALDVQMTPTDVLVVADTIDVSVPTTDVVDSGTRPDVSVPSDGGSTAEARWQMIATLPNAWIYRARDAFKESTQTNRVANGDEIASFRAIGTGIPAVNNVAGVANLVWMGGYDFQSTVNPVWYASFGHKPTFVDRGNTDEYVRFINGLPTNYETEPASLTPAVARGEDFHAVHLFRTMPGSSYEGILAALAGYKDRAGDGTQVQVLYNGAMLLGTSGRMTAWGEDNIVEIKYFSAGTIEVMLNGTVVLTGTLPGLTTMGFTEFVIGTNSHVVSNHFRAIIMRKGGFFSASELSTIRTVSNELWPRGRKPTFPYLDGQFRNDGNDWNGTTRTWQPAVGVFSGGNGTAGAHAFQWYYWIDPGTGSTWPRNNVLDYHLPFPGPRGQMATLKRSDYETGNTYGNPVIFAMPGQNKVKIMRRVIPTDSAGTQGEPLPGQWAPDNIP